MRLKDQNGFSINAFDAAFAADTRFWAIPKPEMLQRIKIGSFMALICL